MITRTKIAPPNSLILIAASAGAVAPDSMTQSGIAATDVCVAVACWPEPDGPTEIALGPAEEVDPGSQPAFEIVLATPNGTLAAWTIEWRSLAEARVPNTRTRIRIWRNHPRTPDKIAIGWE